MNNSINRQGGQQVHSRAMGKASQTEQKNTQETPLSATESRQKENNSWMNHPNLAGMDASKLAMLSAFAEQGAGKSPQDLLPFLMSAASQSKSKGMQFTPQEMDTIIQVLKMGKSPAEAARMDRMLQMLKLMR